ncbi:helix-turn-helix domain-containing protein [Glaciecola sp. 1036]|uniref:AraC family transcriptional regulator n=1 Tax=Alteromonadaceae TaxID=72275 RepID=UPI003D06C60D
MPLEYFTNKDKFLPANLLPKALYELAVARGADAQKLLVGTGIFLQDFENDSQVSCNQLLTLIANAQTLSQGQDLGFQFGRTLIDLLPDDIQDVLSSAKDFHHCLKLMALLKPQLYPFMSSFNHIDEDTLYLQFFDPIGLGKQQRFIQEASCAALVSLSKLCTGRRLKFSFSFPFARPKYMYEYEESLGTRLEFQAPTLMVKIAHNDTQITCKDANPKLHSYALKQVKTQYKVRYSLLEQVRLILRKAPQTTLPDAAALFDMSPASLKRLLKEHSTSFQQLHDELRRQEAMYYLQIQKLKNEQTASKMRFTDVNNFRKAVKRWTGLTPNKLRSF